MSERLVLGDKSFDVKIRREISIKTETVDGGVILKSGYRG